MAGTGIGYVRVAAIGPATAGQVEVADCRTARRAARRSSIVDVRRASNGTIDDGLAIARLFVGKGTLAIREAKGGARETIAAAAGDGAVTLPAVVLVDTGTSGAAEIFASALVGNKRADLIGEHTIGRAASQKLVRLPDGAGLWLSTTRYLTPTGDAAPRKRARADGAGRRARTSSSGSRRRPPIRSRQGHRAAQREKSR